jgi:hypothetical protein
MLTYKHSLYTVYIANFLLVIKEFFDEKIYNNIKNDSTTSVSAPKNNNKNTNPSPEPSEPSEPSAFSFPPKCYRCDFSNYNTKGEYEYHCVTKHPGKPAYPGPADMIKGLTPQGMSWET